MFALQTKEMKDTSKEGAGDWVIAASLAEHDENEGSPRTGI